jgi:sigma-B regulation protein RsbU (phosphoserine phosphatase)
MHRCPVEDKLGDIGRAVGWADNLASQAGLGEDMRYAIQLCLEEALANLVLHGQAPDGRKDILVEFEHRCRGAILSVSDRCLPFDITQLREPSAAAPALARVGGQGIGLLRTFGGRLRYRRDGQRNVLAMTFEPSDPPASERTPAMPAIDADDRKRIRDIAALAPMSDAALAKILHAGAQVLVAPGERLVRQSAPSDAAFILLSGSVAILDENAHGETLLANVSAPALLGEIGALAQIARTATIRAVTPGRALRVERDLLLDVCQQTPQILVSVIARLGEQIQGVNRALGLYAGGLAALERDDFDPAILQDLNDPARGLRDFAAAFQRLARHIVLERRNRKDMASAALIQQAMLPQTLDGLDPRGRCRIYGEMKPARDVGGDFYDAFMLDDDRLALLIGDVCGKGVPASLFMSFAVTALRLVAKQERAVAAVVERTNALLHAHNAASMFTTLFYGVLDLSARRLDYANCGHNPPLIARRGGGCLALAGGGTPLGILPDRRGGSRFVDLAAGDRLLLFTDGVVEAMRPDGEMFGLERLSALVADYAGDVDGLLDAILGDVFAFSRHTATSLEDDCTLVAVSVGRSAGASLVAELR